ncbi:MAG: leucine-rich repeat domain-containing protein [Flavobacteriales bacterium]|nr:leucine-rich repeat domain-containing protein [Flavobacteriales bacterium]
MKYVCTFLLLLFSAHIRAQDVPFEMLDTAKVYYTLEAALNADLPVYRLDLTKSGLKEIPAELCTLSSLQELILDRNKLKSLPQEISKLKNLQAISVSKNKLESFPDFLCNMRSLVRIDLSDNEVDRIPDEIHRLINLKELILWSNVIGYYPSSLIRMEQLTLVDLLHNEMSVQEQERIKTLIPVAELKLSPPCNCTFYDSEEE